MFIHFFFFILHVLSSTGKLPLALLLLQLSFIQLLCKHDLTRGIKGWIFLLNVNVNTASWIKARLIQLFDVPDVEFLVSSACFANAN